MLVGFGDGALGKEDERFLWWHWWLHGKIERAALVCLQCLRMRCHYHDAGGRTSAAIRSLTLVFSVSMTRARKISLPHKPQTGVFSYYQKIDQDVNTQDSSCHRELGPKEQWCHLGNHLYSFPSQKWMEICLQIWATRLGHQGLKEAPDIN